jgi:hypothetical protein
MFGRCPIAIVPILAVCSSFVSGCGTYLPNIVVSNEPHATAFLINKILNHAKCELRDAVIIAHNRDLENARRYHKRTLQWLDQATAKITIKLIAEEKGTLNPGLTWKRLLPSIVTKFANQTSVTTQRSTTFGVGGLLQSDATRTENIDYSYVIKTDFLGNKTEGPVEPRPCKEPGGFFLMANLKIQDWLDGVTLPFLISANVPSEVQDIPPDVLSHEANFVVTTNLNGTPGWTLVNISSATGAWATAGRNRTGDLIVSLGKSAKVQEAHNIAKLNSGFSAAVKSGPSD